MVIGLVMKNLSELVQKILNTDYFKTKESFLKMTYDEIIKKCEE